MHDLLEERLPGGPDVGVTLIRSGKLVFPEGPAKTAAIADQVVNAFKERVTAAAGQPVTAMLHDAGPVSAPGLRVTYEPPLADEQREHHRKMAALQIKGPIEKKGHKTYRLPSIVVRGVSRLGSAGQAPAEASWTGNSQNVLDACELGSLGGALVVRSRGQTK